MKLNSKSHLKINGNGKPKEIIQRQLKKFQG
jgi:hypothetical protein